MSSRRNRQDSVSSQEVYGLATAVLGKALRWTDKGYKCTVRNILLVLLTAASRLSSIHDACQRLKDGPCDQSVYDTLALLLPADCAALERRLNRALGEKLPKSLLKKARPAAVDYFDVNYYGRCHRRKRELSGGKRRDGTDTFHRYATLCVLRRGQRFTLAMTYVYRDDSHAEVVKRLLRRAKARGLKIRYLLLDRGFYGLEVVKLLQSMHCPFVIPVVHRGRRPRRGTDLSKLKGTRRFLAWRKAGFSHHVMDNRKSQARVGIAVAFAWKTTRSGRRRRKRGKPMVFAFWGIKPQSPAWVKDTYRSRYGIETSYRQLNQARARTASRKPQLRLLLVGLALVLRNLWAWVHHQLLGRVRGQSLELRLDRLRFRTMLLMLQRCAEALLGCSERPPNPLSLTRLAADPAP
jgi:hypothetical protein